MKLSYKEKEEMMVLVFEKYKTARGQALYKSVPITGYETLKQFIDFTKYFVMFRGPRPKRNQSSTRKCDARAFDIYQRSYFDTKVLRVERAAFQRGVQWANNRSH